MRTRLISLLLLLFAWAAPASAEVEIAFYSKDLASTFPHAFVRVTGTVESSGAAIDTNYGFTPTHLSLAILNGPVRGMIQTVNPKYVERSVKHFTLPLSEQQYRDVLAVVEKYRSLPQPSYHLNGRNCVDFVAEMATTLGLHAPPVPKLMRKPKSYLRKVTTDNAAMIAQWRRPEPLPAMAPAVATPAPAAPAAAPAQ